MIPDLYPRLIAEDLKRHREHLFRVTWARKVRRLGYVAVRQAMLKRGGDMQDVAWVLITTLMIQGA